MSHEDPLLGRRVVVRSLVRGERGPSGGPAMTDVIGRLEVADGEQIVIRRRDGSARRVARADIIAMKPVGPPPEPRPRPPAPAG